MLREAYLYHFDEGIPLEQIEAQLLFATSAVESLHGESQARLNAVHRLDTSKRTCVIDASTEVGRHFNQLFAGCLLREFGGNSFEVERLDCLPDRDPPPDSALAIFPFRWN